MKKQSRLEEISQKRSLRNTIIILAGVVSLMVLIFFYGIPLVINLSILADKLRGNNDVDMPVNSASYIAPPVLDTLRDATNSAEIIISGSALPNQVIKLYINGKYIEKTTVHDNRNFIFQNIKLEPGDNQIKAKATVPDKESDYSKNMMIVYRNKEPNLDITSPQDNQSISNGDRQVKVTGKTDPSVRVTVNDYWAIVESDGNFSYLLHLQKGDNTIKVAAVDDAGSKTEKVIKVKLE